MTVTPLTNHQWKKVARALGFAFVSTFLGVLVAAGGVQSTYEANIALAWAALVAGINAVLYGMSQLFTQD